MKIRLTESDLHRIISSTVKRIIKEGQEDNELLSKIVEGLSAAEVTSNIGENYVDVPLDNEGNLIASVYYEIEDGRYLEKGMQGDGYLTPDDPDEINGNYQVYVTRIVLDENGDATEIEDNGMVTNALKSLVDPDDSGLNYYEDDDHSGWDERWR